MMRILPSLRARQARRRVAESSARWADARSLGPWAGDRTAAPAPDRADRGHL